MTKAEARLKFLNALDRPSSVEIAKDLARNQLAWIDYVPESEFTIVERAALIKACREFYAVIAPLAEKYTE